jgi:SAM-dependent methyltransferase
MATAVVYLARGADGGLPAAVTFFDAYRRCPPRFAHDLIVIAKGWGQQRERAVMIALAQAHGGSVVELPDDGFDWGAYMRLAPTLTHEWICFLNTHSRPQVDGWLDLLSAPAREAASRVGAVGATASWETVLPSLRLPSPATTGVLLLYPLNALWNLARRLRNCWHFDDFPNPHLRSTAFLVRRDLFVEFASQHKIPRTKDESLRLESGKRGLTAFLRSKGFQVLVRGADAKTFGPEDWNASETFRMPGQRNLLIGDNQTLTYDMADPPLKQKLEQAAWGHAFSQEDSATCGSDLKKPMSDSVIRCRTCGSTHHLPSLSVPDLNQRLDRLSFQYHRCSQCRSLFLDRAPVDMGFYYSNNYPAYATEFSKKERAYIDRLEREKLEIVNSYARGRRLLEIGPAAGEFLKVAQASGYEVRGMEQDAECTQHIKNVLHFDVDFTNQPAKALAAHQDGCDVLVAWHVIEHLPDLAAFVSAAAQAISRPNGIIIFSAPNPDALSFALFGKYWVHLDAPRHLNLVPIAALESLMTAHGLERVACFFDDKVGRHLNRMGWQNSLLNFLHRSQGGPGDFALLGRLLSLVMWPFDRIPGRGAAYTVVYRPCAQGGRG